MSGRATPAGDEGRALLDGLVDVACDGLQLAFADEGAHVGPVREGVAEPHGLRPGGEALHEVVGDRLVDVQPLDGDAELPGGGEAGADGSGGGLLDVGVLQHEHGVLAAELQGDADQPGRGADGDLAAGAGGAGEGDVVGAADDLGADDGALAEDDLEDLGGQSGLDQQVTGPQGGERGLRVGLHHDGVAGDERGQRVAHGEFERVVPGGDLTDDTARLAQFGDLGEGRDDAGVTAGLEVGDGLAPVVAGGDGDGLHLLVGVQAGLAGLQLDEVEDLGLAAEDEVVEAQQDGGPLPYGDGGPGGLGGAGPVEGGGDVLGGGLGQIGQLLPGEGGVVGRAARPDDAADQLGDHLGGDHVGGGAHTGGGGRHGVRTERGVRGLRVRHEAESMSSRRLWVPVGNSFSQDPPPLPGTLLEQASDRWRHNR